MPLSDESYQYLQPLGQGIEPTQAVSLGAEGWADVFRQYLLNQAVLLPPSRKDEGLEGFKSMFLNRGGIESGGRAVPTGATYEQFRQGIKAPPETPPPIPLDEAVLAMKPRTTQQKAVRLLDDWNSITKEHFVNDFTDRHGPLNPKAADKLWEYLQYEGVISDKPNIIGFHDIVPGAVIDLLKELYKVKK